MITFQCAATLDGFSTKAAPNCYGIRVTTQELDKKAAEALFEHKGQYGWLLFRPNEFRDEETPSGDAPDKRKTPAQRLRGVLFAIFKERCPGAPSNHFQAFYEAEMEKIIEAGKRKLDGP